MSFGDTVAVRGFIPPVQFVLKGSLLSQTTTAAGTYPLAGELGIIDGQPILEANQLLVGVRLYIKTGGLSGSFTVEMYYLPPAGAWTNLVFTGAITLAGAAGPPTNQEFFVGYPGTGIALPQFSRMGSICVVNSLTGAPFGAMVSPVFG